MKKITYILALLFAGIISAQTIGEGSSTLTGSTGDITGAASTIVTADLANNRALISNGSGKVAVSAVTTTELSYVSGVTSALQTQLNSKLNSSSYTAADVLSKLLTVDGSGSGLDADLLDGVNGATYARKDQNNNFTTNQSITGTLTATGVIRGASTSGVNGTGTGSANSAWLGLYESNGTTRQGYIGFGSGTNNDLDIYNQTNTRLLKLREDGVLSYNSDAVFTGSVSANNYITTSDERVKKNIQKLAQNDTTRLDIDWKTYNYLDHGNDYRVGVLAQELEIEHPEFVVTNEEGLKAVKYIDLLCAKVAELERRIEQLEKKNK